MTNMAESRQANTRLQLFLGAIVIILVFETLESSRSLHIVRSRLVESSSSSSSSNFRVETGEEMVESTEGSQTDVNATRPPPSESLPLHHLESPSLVSSLCSSAISSTTPLQMWADHLPQIVNGLKHPGDPKDTLREQHEATLHRISPRLPYFVQNLPRDWKLFGRIATKAWTRYQYLQKVADPNEKNRDANATAEEIPPTVKIAIFGGSVTKGNNCYTSVKKVQLFDCGWAMRLGYFINRMAGGDVVELWNGAMGATNTQVGTALLKFEMLPEAMRHPDIIVNSYSVNDMHAKTIDEAKGQEISLRDHVFTMQQEFVRMALRYQTCHDPPLVLFLDDYLGNEQREILATTEAGQSMHILATYYGIGTMSYAHMVRDIVYKNTRETSFSPAGWYRNRKGQTLKAMAREIHPQVGMHITVALAMAYYFLVLASTYCSMEGITQQSLQSKTDEYPGDYFDMRAMPPPLSPSTSLSEISQQWSKSIESVRSSDEATPSCSEFLKAHPEAPDRCTFSWISSLAKKAFADASIEDVFRPYLLDGSKWRVDDAGGKSGWSPVDPGDAFVFETRIQGTGMASGTAATTSTTTTIPAAATQSMTLLYMKSWGEKWTNATAEVKVWNKDADTLLARQELLGFHDKETSEIYPAELNFSIPAESNSTVRVEIRLVAGTTFKVLGLAICSD